MTLKNTLDLARKVKVRKLLPTHHFLRYPREKIIREVEALTAELEPLPFEVHIGLKPFTV
jgi:ribonuclease BN (tRNA processing enzyme)